MRKVGFIFWVLSFASSLYFSLELYDKGINLDTNFLTFISETQKYDSAKRAQELYESRNLQYAIITLSSKNKKNILNFTPILAKKFCESKSVNYCNWSSEGGSNLYSFYYPYRKYLISPGQLDYFEKTDKKIIIKKRLQEIYSPLAMTESSQLSSDPLGIMSSFFRSLLPVGGFMPDEGLLISNSGGAFHSLITLKFDMNRPGIEKEVSHLVVEAKKRLALAPEIKMNAVSGLLYFSEGAKQSTTEASTLGLLSLCLVMLLIVLVWRSALPLLATFLTVIFSSSVGFLFCYLVYSRIHIACLLMGIGLMGVVSDYCIHYFSHNTEGHYGLQKSTLRAIIKPFLLSLLTSIVGYAGFYFTGVIVLQQLAVFAVFGLLAAALTVFFLYPCLPKNRKPLTGVVVSFICGFSRFRTSMMSLSPVTGKLAVICLILGVGLLPKIRFDDDVRKLQKPNSELAKQERIIQDLTGVKRQSQYYLIEAESDQQLLQTEEHLSRLNDKRPNRAELSRLSSWIPSHSRQSLSRTGYNNLQGLVVDFYIRLGVENPKWQASRVYRENSTPKLNVKDWMNRFGHLPVADQYLGKSGKYFYSIVRVESGNFMRESELPNGVKIITRTKEVSKFFKELRSNVMLMILCLVVAALVLIALFTGYKMALEVCLAPCMGLVWSALMCFWIVGYLDLFHILGLVLVFFLSIDYSFFNSFSLPGQDDSVDIGIGVSVFTTIFSFGVLIFSQTAAIHHFGMSVLIGITVSYLFTVQRGAKF